MRVLRAAIHPGFEPDWHLDDIAILYTAIDETEHAFLPIDYLYKQYVSQFKPKGYDIYSKFMQTVTEGDVSGMIDQLVKSDGDNKLAYSIGFGLNCSDRAKCGQPPATAFYIQTPVFQNRMQLAGRPVCQDSPVDFSPIRAASYCLRAENNVGLTQPGDSGGPLFVFDAVGAPVVVGVLTFGDKTMRSFGENLASHFDFLRVAITSPNDGQLRWIDFNTHSDVYQNTELVHAPRVAPAPSPDTGETDSDSVKRVMKRADALAALLSADASEIDAGTRRFYKAQVSFYGKPYSVSQIVKERLAAAKRWPSRKYVVRTTQKVECGSDAQNACSGVFYIDWVISNGATTKTGTTAYHWVFNRSQDMRVSEEFAR